MIRSFKTRTFAKWANKADLSDKALVEAVEEMSRGLVDADLGGHVFKKRIALPGRGKSGGARVLVATKMLDRWFFMLGFEKNEQANIDQTELNALRAFARDLIEQDKHALALAITRGELLEIFHEDR